MVEPGSLDAVTLWHVLEHLDEPRDALARIAPWLEPGGDVLVAVPNLASIQASIGGERWYHLDVPRHRVHFTADGLVELLVATGFRPCRISRFSLEYGPFGMWQSLVSRTTHHPSYLYNLLKRNVPLDGHDLALTAAAVPLAPFAAMAELLAGLLASRGGAIAVTARRVRGSIRAMEGSGGFEGLFGDPDESPAAARRVRRADAGSTAARLGG